MPLVVTMLDTKAHRSFSTGNELLSKSKQPVTGDFEFTGGRRRLGVCVPGTRNGESFGRKHLSRWDGGCSKLN